MVIAGHLVSLGQLFKFIIGIMRRVFARHQLVVGALVVAEFAPKSATGNAQSADAGNERETYDAR